MLRELQQQFLTSILDQQNQVDLLKKIVKANQLEPNESLGIYRNNNIFTLLKTLGNVFQVCEKLVGHEFFAAMAKQFIQHAPSKSLSLNNYGEQFPGFIADFEPAASLIYLADVAKLEWIIHKTSFGADNYLLNRQQLAAVTEEKQENICFYLPHNSQLFFSKYPVLQIWNVNQDDYHGEQNVDLNDGETKILIWCDGSDLRLDKLIQAEWTLLNNINQKLTIAELGQDLAMDIDVVAEIAKLVAKKWIAGFSIKEQVDGIN